MQTYILDLETLLTLLQEVEQNGRLSTTLPSGIPGIKERCQARVDLQEGKIIFCQIEGRYGQVFARGSQALQLLSRLGPQEWQLVDIQQLESLPVPTTVQRPPQNQRLLYTSTLVPQRITFIEQHTLNRLPLRHRQVLNLVDGMRSVERITAILFSSTDAQVLQQVGEILQELEAMKVITVKS